MRRVNQSDLSQYTVQQGRVYRPMVTCKERAKEQILEECRWSADKSLYQTSQCFVVRGL